MEKGKVHILVRLAVLVALEVVLSRFLSITTPYNKIGFAFVPLALAGALYGPWAGLAVGTVADLLGATLFPVAPFFPGFTLTAALKGLVFGLCLQKGRSGSWKAVSGAVCFNAVVLSLGLNTLWLYIMFRGDFGMLLLGRVVQETLVIPLQIVTLRLVGISRIQKSLA